MKYCTVLYEQTVTYRHCFINNFLHFLLNCFTHINGNGKWIKVQVTQSRVNIKDAHITGFSGVHCSCYLMLFI